MGTLSTSYSRSVAAWVGTLSRLDDWRIVSWRLRGQPTNRARSSRHAGLVVRAVRSMAFCSMHWLSSARWMCFVFCRLALSSNCCAIESYLGVAILLQWPWRASPLGFACADYAHSGVYGYCQWLQVIVFKMKPKKHYRRTNGHRQPLSKILVRSLRHWTAYDISLTFGGRTRLDYWRHLWGRQHRCHNPGLGCI